MIDERERFFGFIGVELFGEIDFDFSPIRNNRLTE